ncbi:hypothetical protein RQP46_009481 [Phenoliferia psychrophenolica]
MRTKTFLLQAAMATTVVLAAMDGRERPRRGDRRAFDVDMSDQTDSPPSGETGSVASASMGVPGSDLAPTTAFVTATHAPSAEAASSTITTAPAPTQAPILLNDPDRRGLLDPLLGLLTDFIPSKYLTAPITVAGTFIGHAQFPPIASVVAEIDGVLNKDLPLAALLDNLMSEITATGILQIG